MVPFDPEGAPGPRLDQRHSKSDREWIARQVTEAFPWDETPRYLIRDQDRGAAVTRRLRAMGIRDKPIAPGSPWQNGFAERLIGSIRRECADHLVALGEGHLRRILQSYARYYNELRTHRSLNKDSPIHRSIEKSRYNHFTANSRWTSPPILPNLIFGTHSSPEIKFYLAFTDCMHSVGYEATSGL